MYLNFFGLNKDPFKITPDPEFFFAGGNRGAVLEALCYAIAKGEGIVKVVGEVGSGKTMLCRMLEQELPDNCDIIYLANPRLNPDDVLIAIAHELQLELPDAVSKIEALSVLHSFLLEKHAADRRVVMFIEEAQGMQLETLEEIRMLSNLETTQEKLLQIVLFGQPELDQKLAAHEIRQLNERITYSFDLASLNQEEIRDYVYTRLRASGYRGNGLFSKSAIRLLSKRSLGLLRRINVLADKALLAAFSQGAHKVDKQQMAMAINDSNFAAGAQKLHQKQPGGWLSKWWKLGPVIATLLVIAGLGGLVLTYWHNVDNQAVSDASLAPSSTEQFSIMAHDNAKFAPAPSKQAGSEAGFSPRTELDSQINAQSEETSFDLVSNSPTVDETAANSAELANQKYLAVGMQMFEALKFETSVVTAPTLGH